MIFTAFRGMKPASQFFFAAFVILSCFLTFMALAFVIAIPIWGLDVAMNISNLKDLGNPETVIVLKYLQTIQSIGFFIVPTFILGYLFSGNAIEYLFLNKSVNWQSVPLVILLIMFSAPFINLIGELNGNINLPDWMSGIEDAMKRAEEKAAMITETFLNVKGIGGLAFNLFMIAFLPAVGEELLFRGVIQKIFTQMTKNYHTGIWISAILFSALHMQFYGFVPRMFLGAMFGYLLVWSGTMWLPIIGHFINNAIAVVAMFFINMNVLSPEFENIGSTSDSYYMAAVSLVLIIALMLMIKRCRPVKNNVKESSI